MAERVQCLDKGFVQLLDWKGSDLDIARAARVQPEAEWRGEADEKLIRYMLRNRHNTPFEHVVFTFWVKAPIFVYRQWHRHRTQSYNEQSARYMVMDGEFYVPEIAAIGKQSEKNHQAREVGGGLTVVEATRLDAQRLIYAETCEAAVATYKRLLDLGWPRELARMCLPVSVYSEMTTTVSLHNLFHFLGLRDDDHAQPEIRVYAKAILGLIRPVVPVAVGAWEELRARP